MALGSSSYHCTLSYWMALQRLCCKCSSCWFIMGNVLCCCQLCVFLHFIHEFWKSNSDNTFDYSHNCDDSRFKTFFILNLEKLGIVGGLLISKDKVKLWRKILLDHFIVCCFWITSSSLMARVVSSMLRNSFVKWRVRVRICRICALVDRIFVWGDWGHITCRFQGKSSQ